MEKKKASITIVGTDPLIVRDVEMVKGSTVTDLKKAARIPTQYTIVRKATNENLREGQDLFSILDNNELLRASPPATVGRGVREILSQIFFPEPKAEMTGVYVPDMYLLQQEAIVQRNSVENDMDGMQFDGPTVTAIPSEFLGVEEELIDKGWVRSDNALYGTVVDIQGIEHPVRIVKLFGNEYRLFIRNPPIYVLHGGHGSCFNSAGDGWYWLHFRTGSNYPLGMVEGLQILMNPNGGRAYA
jgi:hypothetical protein